MFSNFFGCCDKNKTFKAEDNEKENEAQRKIELLKNNIYNENHDKMEKLDSSDDDEIIVDEKLIMEEEKNFKVLKFSKNGLVKYFEYYDNMQGFEKLYENDNLLMTYKKSGSDLIDSIYLGKTEYKINKQMLKSEITLKQIRDIVYLLLNKLVMRT